MMISLLADVVTALIKTVDRCCTAVEENVRLRFAPRTVEGAQPAEAGTMPASATGLGGHHLRPTSELLWIAAHQVTDPDLVTQLRDHAAQLAAHGL
jgi:hypothetical protein